MGRKAGGRAISPDWLQRIISDTVDTLRSQHPGVHEELVFYTVQDAALELFSALSDLASLPLLLHRRANGRLLAVTGQPLVISSAAQVISPRY